MSAIQPSIQSTLSSHLQLLVKYCFVEHFGPTSGNELTIHLNQEPTVVGLDAAVEHAVNKHLVSLFMGLLNSIFYELRDTGLSPAAGAKPSNAQTHLQVVFPDKGISRL